jgi:hypothetical protein
MQPVKPAFEKDGAEIDRMKEKSEATFRAWRTAYYRRITGELKTDRTLNAAREAMEAAGIRRGLRTRRFAGRVEPVAMRRTGRPQCPGRGRGTAAWAVTQEIDRWFGRFNVYVEPACLSFQR